MHVTLVHVYVKPDCVQDFIVASCINHENSIKESGNRRFDILQDAHDPNKFILYEAYATAADAEAHKKTAHYLQWRETVAPMMANPREGIPYTGLFPPG
ncbi:MAG: antibiotic biosynthesis monooxygenase [Beggiatoa sp. IS2]|nr:MAG: antibiotic biosynthesis monooxygenase [Beggiatoa sp. IS2]